MPLGGFRCARGRRVHSRDQSVSRSADACPIGDRMIDGQEAAIAGGRKNLPQSCDCAIMFEDAVVLIEVKAQLFDLPSRPGQSLERLNTKLHEIAIDGARQLDAMITMIQRRELLSVGLDPTRLRCYFPFIVTLEELPLSRLLYLHIGRMVARKGYLQQKGVRALQIMTADELESAEAAIRNGYSLRTMLEAKLADRHYRFEGFKTFCLARKNPFYGDRSPYLASVFNRLTDQATAFLASRERPATRPAPR